MLWTWGVQCAFLPHLDLLIAVFSKGRKWQCAFLPHLDLLIAVFSKGRKWKILLNQSPKY
jgi:hypothetical protein